MKIVTDCFKLVKGAGKSSGIYDLALHLVTHLVKEKKVTGNAQIRDSEITVIGNEQNQSDFDREELVEKGQRNIERFCHDASEMRAAA